MMPPHGVSGNFYKGNDFTQLQKYYLEIDDQPIKDRNKANLNIQCYIYYYIKFSIQFSEQHLFHHI